VFSSLHFLLDVHHVTLSQMLPIQGSMVTTAAATAAAAAAALVSCTFMLPACHSTFLW
jgi:hypothetical protein